MHTIHVNNLSIEYPVYGFSSRILKNEILRIGTGGIIKNKSATVVIKALDDVSFTLQEGDRLGLIGHNGAGKSTLLRALGKIFPPTQGSVNSYGKISTLFELCLGLDEEMTDYENIIARGIIHGLAEKEILALRDKIIEKSDLGKYIYMPLRTYSSGMRMRLAFSVVTSLPNEILLIDEVLGAGDAQFFKKAKIYFKDMVERAKIVVISTHNTTILSDICNKLLILDKGKIKYFGDNVKETLVEYEKEQTANIL